MKGYRSATYGDRIAAVYDFLHAGAFDTDATIEFLRDLAPRGPALELGVGTGRIALGLGARGAEVHGVDVSVAMIAELRSHADALERVETTVADVAGLDLGRRFEVVYAAGNTIFASHKQQVQQEWFHCARRHLGVGGKFVVEAFVPDATLFDRGSRVQTSRAGPDQLQLIATLDDAVAQVNSGQHVVLRPGSVDLFPVRIRYAPPAELDLMARRAGFDLLGRWEGWRRRPFEASSRSHVSLYVASR